MVRFSVCVEMIFRNVPFPDRAVKVKEVGMPAFEFWGWDNKGGVEVLKKAKQDSGLQIAAFSGGKGPLVDPAVRANYLTSLKASIQVAQELGCPGVLQTTGNTLPNVPRMAQHQSIVDHLLAAKPILEAENMMLYLEPLNTIVDHKGYYLETSKEGFDIVRKVDSQKVKLLYDIYHMQIMEGNVIQTIEQNIGLIGHFHVADVPGRFEPGTGELNYANIFKRIEKAGYKGYVGLEFRPTGDHAEALKKVLQLAA